MLKVPRGDAPEALTEQPTVHACCVLKTAPVRIGLAESNPSRCLDELRDATRREKHVWAHRAPEEHVVVGVDEVLAQPRDVLQLAFYRVRIVCGEH